MKANAQISALVKSTILSSNTQTLELCISNSKCFNYTERNISLHMLFNKFKIIFNCPQSHFEKRMKKMHWLGFFIAIATHKENGIYLQQLELSKSLSFVALTVSTSTNLVIFNLICSFRRRFPIVNS